ncbi:fimbrillin family protein [Prevotella sp. A2879]|uniref:Fimbrillin family protein n=1 Tax=Prevotella vespertina TaxID=2608404 RepID=A0A7C9LSU7_9BACT|nr:hypothetical protein [Prevotella vespertina]MUL28481.1 fimbrillin family protein [Prevotella vespertina]
MRTRQLFKTSLLSLTTLCSMALAVVSCANEDIAQNNTGSNNDKNYTTFVAGEPTKTRTSMNYNSGKFYWEEGDKIYVKDDDGTLQESNAVDAAHAHSESFSFRVPGKFNNSATYKVYYLGKSGSGNQVTIPTAQTQTKPNDTEHIGDFGDYGTATANGTIGGGSFHFQLEHQATYLVFQPYTSNAILQNCYLTKIEVTSDNDIAETYTVNTSTGNLDASAGSKQIVLTTKDPVAGSTNEKGFSFTNAASISTADKIYMLIKPGAHTLKVRYWIKDYVTNVEGTITKTLSSFNYAKNTYYDMTASLDTRNYDSNYCLWDAQQPFWYGHEWNAPNPADRWQPLVSMNPFPHASELINPTDARAASTVFPGQGVRNDAVNLCKDCPNANEIAWYTEKGDPRFDADEIWITMGHLYKGGFWLKKKSKMALDNSTTVANIEGSGPDGTDWRTLSFSKDIAQNYPLTTIPSANEINNYFFIPSIGVGEQSPYGKIFRLDGTMGMFWSSNSSVTHDGAQAMSISYDGSQIRIYVTTNYNRNYNIGYPLKFE